MSDVIAVPMLTDAVLLAILAVVFCPCLVPFGPQLILMRFLYQLAYGSTEVLFHSCSHLLQSLLLPTSTNAVLSFNSCSCTLLFGNSLLQSHQFTCPLVLSGFHRVAFPSSALVEPLQYLQSSSAVLVAHTGQVNV